MYGRLLAVDESSGDQGSLAMEHTNLGSVLLQTCGYATTRSHL